MRRLGGTAERPRPTPLMVRFEDIPPLLGRRFHSQPFVVTPGEASRFQKLTYFRPLAPEETSAEVVEGVVEGFHTLSLVDALVNEHIRFDRRECFVLNYGVDSVRFPAQLTQGRPLEFAMTIGDIAPRGDAVVISVDVAVGEQGSVKPGLAGRWRLYVARRAS